MRKLIPLVLLLGAVAFAATTREVLVQTTPTLVSSAGSHQSVLITNNGPNDIWCALGADSTKAVVNKSQPVRAGGGSLAVDSSTSVYCVAATANQVTGAGTSVSEAP